MKYQVFVYERGEDEETERQKVVYDREPEDHELMLNERDGFELVHHYEIEAEGELDLALVGI